MMRKPQMNKEQGQGKKENVSIRAMTQMKNLSLVRDVSGCMPIAVKYSKSLRMTMTLASQLEGRS